MENSKTALIAARCGMILAILFACYRVILVTTADYLSQSSRLQDRARAAALLPAPPHLDRLAYALQDAGQDPVPILQRAAALEPANPEILQRLALQAELRGDLPLAEASLLRSAALSQLFIPRFFLAQFYFRRNQTVEFHHWGREALDRSYGNISGLVDLYWRLDPDPRAFAHSARSSGHDTTRAFLTYSLEHELWDPSSLLARDIAAQATADDLPALFRYMDQALLHDHLQFPAVGVWNALVQSGLVPAHNIDPSHPGVTNPSFAKPSGHAFDWHLAADPDAQIATPGGALQISLSGDQPEFLILTWQYVPVRQGAICTASIDSRELSAGVFHYAADGRWLELNGGPAPSTMVRLAIYYRRNPGTTRFSGLATARNPALECRP